MRAWPAPGRRISRLVVAAKGTKQTDLHKCIFVQMRLKLNMTKMATEKEISSDNLKPCVIMFKTGKLVCRKTSATGLIKMSCWIFFALIPARLPDAHYLCVCCESDICTDRRLWELENANYCVE